MSSFKSENNTVNAKWDSAERVYTNAGVSKFNPNPSINAILPSTPPLEGEEGHTAPHAPRTRAATAGRTRSSRPSSRPASTANSARRGANSNTNRATVAYAGDTELLPTHMRSILLLLEQNINALRHFSSRFQIMTNSELHAAGINLNALVGSQEMCLRDLSHFTAKEVKHGKERIRDLSVQLHTEKDEVARQLHTMELCYTAVSTIAGITAAKEAILFLFPRGRSKETEHMLKQHRQQRRNSASALSTGGPPSERTGIATPPPGSSGQYGEEYPEEEEEDTLDDEQFLNLVAHVSTEPFDSLADGGTSPDVYDICNAVAQSKCAANIKTSSAGPVRSFDSIVACPILPPGEVAPIGVLCVVNKIAAYEPQFSADDECRVIYAGEQIAQMLAMFPLTVSRTVPLLITPHSYQQLYRQWVGLDHQRHAQERNKHHHEQSLANATAAQKKLAVLTPALPTNDKLTVISAGTLAPHMRDPISKKFIFRATHNGRMLDELRHVKSRLAVSPAEVLIDVLDRYKILEQQLDKTSKRLSSALSEVETAHKEVLQARENSRKFEQQSAEMQVASERVMRMAYMQGRIGKPGQHSQDDAEDDLTAPSSPSISRPATAAPSSAGRPGAKSAGRYRAAPSKTVSVTAPEEQSPGPVTPQPPRVVDLSMLPPEFLQRAAGLKSRSFFPTSTSAIAGGALGHRTGSSSGGVDARWNRRSKMVGGGSFLKHK